MQIVEASGSKKFDGFCLVYITSETATMRVIDTYNPVDYQAHQLAQIQTDYGVLAIDWIPEGRQIACHFEGRHWIGQDESIGSTLEVFLGKNQTLLVPSELKIYDSPGKFTYGTEKELQDLFRCEWSDYACDRLLFQCSVYEVNRT